jgi:hypothetical protein
MLEVVSSQSLDYTKVLELDKTIRNFYIPPIFEDSDTAFSRPLTMQKASLLTALEAGMAAPFFILLMKLRNHVQCSSNFIVRSSLGP